MYVSVFEKSGSSPDFVTIVAPSETVIAGINDAFAEASIVPNGYATVTLPSAHTPAKSVGTAAFSVFANTKERISALEERTASGACC